MKIEFKNFRVKEGEPVDLKKWPTQTRPDYKSKEQYQEILDEHIRKLSAQQSLLYASNHYSLLVIFQALDAAGKDGAVKHVLSGINPEGCEVFSLSSRAPKSWNTIFSGARPAVCRSAAASAFLIAPITRKCWSCASIRKFSTMRGCRMN